MDSDDRDARISSLESQLAEALSRIRRLETRLNAEGLLSSNRRGQTKRIRLSDDGESLEVE